MRSAPPFAPTPEESAEDAEAEEVQLERSTSHQVNPGQRSAAGEMNPQFRFPSSVPGPVKERKSPPEELDHKTSAPAHPSSVVTPSSIEVPPPPPVEKEQSTSSTSVDEGEDDVGDTVDIPLN